MQVVNVNGAIPFREGKNLQLSTQHIVLFSGGLASFEVANRVLTKYSEDQIQIWFFDTLIEDEDLYRFIYDAENWLGFKIKRFADGRNPWEVFRDERFIGNSRINLCTRVLKTEMLEQLLKEYYPDKNAVLHFGLEDSEIKRIDILTQKWKSKGYKIDFLLRDIPKLSSVQIHSLVKEKYGIEPPRLYKMGFRHNNCGGACVKAGISQWISLYHYFPERYLWHEHQEELTRNYLNKDVSILRNRSGGSVRPLTLRELRLKINGNFK